MRRSWTGGLAALALISASALAPASAPAAEASTEARALLLVLDASGSMWGQIGGKNKIVIAREVVSDLLATLPDTTEMGLVAYGHRRESDCADVEVLAPVGRIDKTALAEQVAALNPRGKTPLAASAEAAVAEVRRSGSPATVVLVTDGVETCGGDLCQVVREARAAGVELRLHVVGFDLGAEEVSVLECAAEAGGGRYFDAADAAALAAALEEATAEVALPAGRLVVGAKADGELLDASVIARPAGGGDEVSIRTYKGPETNPATLLLPDGTYDVEVRPVGMRGVPPIAFPGVEVAEGREVRRDADFSTGELAVGVTRNGDLSDATVRVVTADGEAVTSGRTYRGAGTNPKSFRVPPGRYGVVVSGIELSDKPERRLEAEVEPGGRAELTVALSSGELRVGAARGGELVDATVHVVRAEDGRQVGSGRTYASETTNPKAFTLSPGRYRVDLGAVKLPGSPKRSLEVTVEAGETVTVTADFGGG